MKELKDKCIELRTFLGLSQTSFAIMIHTNQTEVSFIERGFIPKKKQVDLINLFYDNIFKGEK